MKIFVTSDTHRNLDRVLRIYDLITGDTPEGVTHVDSFDLMIHCGDLKPDARKLGKRLGLETVCVYGNCDHAADRAYGGHDIEKVPTPAGTILVTHGDLELVNSGHTNLLYLAEQEGCNCVCYGHTHLPVFDSEDGIFVVNPGSPSRPLDGTAYGSCAILNAEENGYSGEILYYEDLFGDEDCEGYADGGSGRSGGADGGSGRSGGADKSSGSKDGSAKKNGKSGVGGFLRKIFNYSDGQ